MNLLKNRVFVGVLCFIVLSFVAVWYADVFAQQGIVCRDTFYKKNDLAYKTVYEAGDRRIEVSNNRNLNDEIIVKYIQPGETKQYAVWRKDIAYGRFYEVEVYDEEALLYTGYFDIETGKAEDVLNVKNTPVESSDIAMIVSAALGSNVVNRGNFALFCGGLLLAVLALVEFFNPMLLKIMQRQSGMQKESAGLLWQNVQRLLWISLPIASIAFFIASVR